ncbi:hypothetical protein ACWDAQ_41385, partial [Streptomyces sp. NPDC001139]
RAAVARQHVAQGGPGAEHVTQVGHLGDPLELASSPPAEVVFADPRPKTAPTGTSYGTCFRQIEYAGLLHNARNAKGGKAFIDFLLGKEFQQDMPLNMFVYPVVEGAKVPKEFTEYGPAAKDPQTMAPTKIAANRDQWVKSWTSLVLQ